MERFDNVQMPAWLEYGLLKSFREKDIDCIKGYQKLWEDMMNRE